MPPVNASPASVAEAHAENVPATGVPATAAPLDASVAPNELHVQIAAPFVFHATGPPPAPIEDVRALPLDSRPRVAPALAAPLPPPSNPPSRGFFKRLGGFFASLFH
jgi:hypothetical protein